MRDTEGILGATGKTEQNVLSAGANMLRLGFFALPSW